MEDFEKDRKYLGIIYCLIIISTIVTIFIIPNFLYIYSNILNLILWVIIFLLARNITNQHNRFKGLNEKIKTVIIIVFIYIIAYELSGLFFGYSKSIYSHTINAIIQNMLFYIGIIMLKEYTRSRLINNTRSKILYTLITIIFIVIDFNYINFFNNFATGESSFKFVSSQIYPAIIEGILCSFLVRIGSYKLSLSFLLPMELFKILTPIVPDIDWFIIVALESVLVLLIYYYTKYEHLISVERYTRKEIKQGNPKSAIPSITFVLLFTLFVAGIFPIKPVALLSNSMSPYFERGDVVLVKKVKQEDLKNIVVGDIIEYSLESKTVIHRIINIIEGSGGERTFITKGDANNLQDSPVTEEQVIGVIKKYVPYIGYPSVIFSESILKIKE